MQPSAKRLGLAKGPKDGERLVELFEEKDLGVKPKQILTIDYAFFYEFRK